MNVMISGSVIRVHEEPRLMAKHVCRGPEDVERGGKAGIEAGRQMGRPWMLGE